MSTALSDKPRIAPPDAWPPDGEDGDSGGGGGGGGGARRFENGPPISSLRMLTIFVIACVIMLFGSLLSVFAILGEGDGWPPKEFFQAQEGLFLSTVIILCSSVFGFLTMTARRSSQSLRFSIGLFLTWAAGLGFCFTQVQVWDLLSNGGLGIETSPFASSFYILTVAHALHVGFGILFLTGITVQGLFRLRAFATMRNTASHIMLYWHTITVIWLGLYALLYQGS